MAKGTYLQEGNVIDWTNKTGSDVAYHDVVPLVNRIGVAAEAIADDATGSVAITGVWEIPAVNNTAFDVGDVLYYDAAAEKLTKTAAGNVPAGWCVEPKDETGTTAKIDIGKIPILATAGG